MGAITPPHEVLLIVAASSRYLEALSWGLDAMQQVYGHVALVSEAFDFTETDYYLAEMGPDLKKQFWAFTQKIDPAALPAVKHATNAWEASYASLQRSPESRPLNLDPGYITQAKLVLASTKDHAHRLYLGEGIYGEITLRFQKKAWRSTEWTYPDYRRADFHRFFDECRNLLRT
ncbi:MAG: DUF4416 family protein [Planctomycetales bacterium]|nr:DUF4416 family protein [Planctomycetales bacterium]